MNKKKTAKIEIKGLCSAQKNWEQKTEDKKYTRNRNNEICITFRTIVLFVHIPFFLASLEMHAQTRLPMYTPCVLVN